MLTEGMGQRWSSFPVSMPIPVGLMGGVGKQNILAVICGQEQESSGQLLCLRYLGVPGHPSGHCYVHSFAQVAWPIPEASSVSALVSASIVMAPHLCSVS